MFLVELVTTNSPFQITTVVCAFFSMSVQHHSRVALKTNILTLSEWQSSKQTLRNYQHLLEFFWMYLKIARKHN